MPVTSIDGLDQIGDFAPSAFSAQNKDSATIPKGGAAASHSSGTGVVRALAADESKVAVGLAQTAIAATFAGLVQAAGLFTLADWSLVPGTVTLSAKGLYFLDPVNPGMLTLAVPTTVGQVCQLVGEAVASDTMNLLMAEPILL
jgi:hypothetical protein